MITGARVTEILADGVKYIKDGQEETLRGMDTMVLAIGTKPNNTLAENLKGRSTPAYMIGDAKEPRNAADAIAEGSEIGGTI